MLGEKFSNLSSDNFKNISINSGRVSLSSQIINSLAGTVDMVTDDDVTKGGQRC